jgi:anti-anti-sigma factor
VVPMEPLLTSRAVAGRNVVAVRGEIDVRSALAVQARIVGAAAERSGDVVLDAHEVTRMDDAGCAAFIAACWRIRASGRRLEIVSPPAAFRAMLTAAGAHRYLPMQGSLRDIVGPPPLTVPAPSVETKPKSTPLNSSFTSKPGRIKLLLVDDHDLIRKGLRHAFERDRQFEVVGEAATAAGAVRQAGALQPDVVIMDLRLPDGSGLEATKALRKNNANMGIVVLTMFAGDDQLFGALEAGASAFVPKSAPADEVVAAARHAASAPSAFTAADLAEAMKRRLAPSGPQLSPREGQVLRLLADGMSVAGIAKQLFVSDSTAKTHISKLYEKFGAANRAQALMTALRLGLLEAPDAPRF